MNSDDHLSNEVSVDARLTESGLSAKTRSRAVAACDRLLGSVLDVPALKMESYASRIRARSRLEETALDAAAERLAGTIGSSADAARLVDGLVASQMRLLANKSKVAQRAVEYLVSPGPEGKSDPEPDAADVEPDWLNHFAGHAEKADSAKVRDLWARVLAGEVRRPGSFSLTTLRLLAELDQRMASWFQEEVEFRFMGRYVLPPDRFNERMDFLEQVGLIHHVAPIGGLVHTIDPGSQGFATVFEGDLCLRIHLDKALKFNVVPITRAGLEIASILPPVDPRAVFVRLAKAFHDDAKSIDICRIIERHQDGVCLSVPIEVLKSADVN